MTTLQTVISIIGLIISCGTLCTMMYGFFKFLSKPHDTLEQRVKALENWQTETNARLKHGSDKFEAQDRTNEVILRSVLALIEFEMDYCTSEHKPISRGLEKAKEDLHEYLASK